MMMPANFSAIAEEEMTYVSGGAFDIAGGAAKLGKNLWTIVGNSFISSLVSSTLGVMFGGNYLVGGLNNGVFSALGDVITGNGKYNFINGAMQVIGLGAAGYQLASKDVKPVTSNAKYIMSVSTGSSSYPAA